MSTRLAQSVERLTLNQVVEGSSPSVGVFFVFTLINLLLKNQKFIFLNYYLILFGLDDNFESPSISEFKFFENLKFIIIKTKFKK